MKVNSPLFVMLAGATCLAGAQTLPAGVEREFTATEYAAYNSRLDAGGKAHRSAARLIKAYFPAYPRDVRVPGQCVVEFTVDTHGNVRDMKRVREDDKRMCDHALIAMAGWKFQPAGRQDRPVKSRYRVPITYAPDADRPAAPAHGSTPAFMPLAIKDLRISGARAHLSVPGFPHRTAPQARALMCEFARLAAQRGYTYWAVQYPDEDGHDLVVGFSNDPSTPLDDVFGDDYEPGRALGDGMAHVAPFLELCATKPTGT